MDTQAEAKHKAEDQYYQSCKSRYDDALTIHKTQKYKKAFPLFEEIANKGYAPAQEMLGVYYKNGQGVWKDTKKSDEWYGKAFEGYSKFAERGVAEAQCNLGSCYFYGKGTSKDYAKSAEWYGKAAEQGFAKAQYDMGHCYHYGQGVPQDYAKAVEWYEKAANQGYGNAQKALEELKAEGKIPAESSAPQSPQGKIANDDQVNNILAQANALMEHDPNKALELFQKAAHLGSGEAMFVLYSVLDQQDENDPQTKNAANVYLQKAAQAGYVDAQVILATSYETGEGVQKNAAEAAKWYLKAAEQGDPDAQFGIGRMLLIGEGVEENEEEGLKWLSAASDQGQADAKKCLDAINNAKTKRNVGIVGSIAKGVIKGLSNAVG